MLRSLVLAFIISAHLFFVLLPPHATALSESDVESYSRSLIDALHARGIEITKDDASALVDEARQISKKLFGNNGTRAADFTALLLNIYARTAGEDVVILSTPGGWGKVPIAKGEFKTVIEGMMSTLEGWGYSPIWIDYLRTGNGVSELVNEFWDIPYFYATKGRELADIVQFITDHNPDLRVILAGLSQGGSQADRALRYLQDNPRVFGVVGGPPFYQQTLETDRTLVLRSNGEVPDNWSQGPRRIIVQAFGSAPLKWLASGMKGKLANYVRAPGHMYEWGYPTMRAEIIDYLRAHFEDKSLSGVTA